MHIAASELQALRTIHDLLTHLDAEESPLALAVNRQPVPQDDSIVFPGSFNPPTIAHLALLQQAQEYAGQQIGPMSVYAAFSQRTVNKESVERPLLLDRVWLLQQVLARQLSSAGILLFNRGLYVEQAQAIRASFPDVRRLFFLLGFDKIVQILDPRYYQRRDEALTELFAQAQLLVAPREQDGPEALWALLDQPQNRAYQDYIHPISLPEAYRHISSTRVREHGQSGDVPPEVQAFSARTHAYETSDKDGFNPLYEERVQQLARYL